MEVSRCAQPHRTPVAAAHEALGLLPPPWPPRSLEEKERWEGKPMILLACCQLLRQFLEKGGELWKEGEEADDVCKEQAERGACSHQ